MTGYGICPWPRLFSHSSSLYARRIILFPRGRRRRRMRNIPWFRCRDGHRNTVVPLVLSNELDEIHINRAEPESNLAIGEVVLPHPPEALVETQRLDLRLRLDKP